MLKPREHVKEGFFLIVESFNKKNREVKVEKNKNLFSISWIFKALSSQKDTITSQHPPFTN